LNIARPSHASSNKTSPRHRITHPIIHHDHDHVSPIVAPLCHKHISFDNSIQASANYAATVPINQPRIARAKAFAGRTGGVSISKVSLGVDMA